MSAEFFETIFAVDMRTSPDHPRKVEYGRPGTMTPRMFNPDRSFDTVGPHTWVTVHPYVHEVLALCADTIRATPMDGITCDHEAERHIVADRLDVLARAVRYLAEDAAYDSCFDRDTFNSIMARETA